MQQENKDQHTPKENEVDLGVFYTVISRAFKRIGYLLGAFFKYIGSFFVNLLLLIKRNLLWLGISAVIGFGLGFYLQSNSDPSYYAEMIVKTNFESSRLLYQKIDYFNSLIRQNETKELAKIFNITEPQAKQLQSFQISAIEDPLQVAYLYKSIYLDHRRNATYSTDTGWIRTMDYKSFSQNLMKYDFPLHSIILYSHNPGIYPKAQAGIIESMHQNTFLVKAKDSALAIYRQEENILNTSLNGIDSLRKAYYKKIQNSTSDEGGGKILLSPSSARAPEIDLYDKELMLKDELVRIKQKNIDEQDIVQVYADFNNVGQQVSGLGSKLYVRLTWIALLVAFTIIIMARFYRYLILLEKSYEENIKRKRI